MCTHIPREGRSSPGEGHRCAWLEVTACVFTKGEPVEEQVCDVVLSRPAGMTDDPDGLTKTAEQGKTFRSQNVSADDLPDCLCSRIALGSSPSLFVQCGH